MDRLFESMYDERGRYSVPPEWLLRGLVLQALYGIRSERLLYVNCHAIDDRPGRAIECRWVKMVFEIPIRSARDCN